MANYYEVYIYNRPDKFLIVLTLSNAEGTTFELNSAGNVQFYISDTRYGDNRGGLSLRVTQVPEPSALILFAATVLMMLRVRKS